MFDLQVNGYGGIDLNAPHLTLEEVLHFCARVRGDGTEEILGTVITAPPQQMLDRVAQLAATIESHAEVAAVIRGLHIEGPFLNPEPGYIGAHAPAAVQHASIDFAARLVEAGRGTIRLWTLAPEMDPDLRCTQWLTGQGIVVAGGHSNASRSDLQRAIDAGMRLFTHLGNGCPADLPRHDNIIQRVLSCAGQLAISWIADGHHVPFFALANYLRCIPPENVILVSDAMAAAGCGPGTYWLAGAQVEVDAERAAWGAGRKNFAGSATSLPQMRDLLAERLGISPHQLALWTDENPRRWCPRGSAPAQVTPLPHS